MLSRRQFHLAAIGSLTASRLLPALNSVVEGVQIGAQTYSFRDRSVDAAIQAMVDIGLNECELWEGHVAPPLEGDELMKWRETVPLSAIHQIREKFDKAGIRIYAFSYGFRDPWSDRAIEHGFEIAHALGTNKITSSTDLATVPRIDKYAQQYKIYVGMHNHSNMKAGEFNTPKSFSDAMDGHSKYICINLDIGHFTAAGFDPAQFLAERHERILTLHIKDRKKSQGDNMPFGHGDTQINAVLQELT
jgi:sugar phosphate isomerase/epimerase